MTSADFDKMWRTANLRHARNKRLNTRRGPFSVHGVYIEWHCEDRGHMVRSTYPMALRGNRDIRTAIRDARAHCRKMRADGIDGVVLGYYGAKGGYRHEQVEAFPR